MHKFRIEKKKEKKKEKKLSIIKTTVSVDRAKTCLEQG